MFVSFNLRLSSIFKTFETEKCAGNTGGTALEMRIKLKEKASLFPKKSRKKIEMKLKTAETVG